MNKDIIIARLDEENNTLTISFCGEIDHHMAFSIREQIDEMLKNKRPRILVLDLKNVYFMDSSGLGLIMGRYSLMEKLGGLLVVKNPSGRVKKIINLAGLERIIKIEYVKEGNK